MTKYVQASKFDQFNIPTSEKENFITLALPREFVILWQKQGYTHLHFGAVRLALTFHGRKGFPIASRISLLDSRFLEYHNAVIGIVQATLNAGTVFVTLFPNFNMSLKDLHFCDALKVQVQITGASQSMENSQKAATQALPMQVYMPYQPRQSLYKDLSIPLTSPFSPVSPYQNLQPLTMTHLTYNPFKPSGIFSSIISPTPLQLEPQTKPQNDPPLIKKDKESLYQPPDPTIGASSRPSDMNMLAINSNPPNPISSFLRTLTLQESTKRFVLPVIDDTDLDLSDLELDEVFMTDSKVEEEEDVFHPKQPPPPPLIFPPPPFIPDYHTRLTYSSTTDSKHLFTIDNSPPSKWHDEIFNMYSWCTTEFQAPNNTVAQIIAKFINLGEYKQRQAAQCNTLEDFFTIIHNEFLGSLTHYTEVAKEEFLLMKCCSFERKDLEKHFDRMSSRYYSFNGMDDVNSKHTFLNSFPKPLGDETICVINLQKITMQQASLGEIYQHVLIALEKLCNQRNFLSEIDKVHNKLKDNCKRKDLQIKCYVKNCAYPTKRRDHFKKYFWKKKHSQQKKFFRKKKKWKFLRRKQFKGKFSKVCFVCRRPGHFAKNCPKREKAAKLLKQAQIHADDTPFSDVESLFSLDDDYSPQALAVMAYSSSEDESDNTDDSDPEFQTIYTSQSLIAPLTSPPPITQVHILLDTYSRPIPVIALFDTGAAATILHSKILLKNF
ncbi:hypothetical protein ACB092_11G121300 [Castanea dentata]